MLIFEGVDFCFGSSGASNISKIKNPFDYIERGDDQLHVESLIAQFWPKMTILEASKHDEIDLVKAAKVKSCRPLLFLFWTNCMK